MEFKRGKLSGALMPFLTVGAFLLALAIGISVRNGEWFRALEFLILTIAAAWIWLRVKEWPDE
jgi:hypothetical protein